MLFCFVSSNKVNAGNDSVGCIELQFVAGILGIGAVVHETKVFVIEGCTSVWVADSEVGIDSDLT